MLLLVGAGLAVMPQAAATADSVPATEYTPPALQPETPSPSHMLTDTSGGVTVGCGSFAGTKGFVTRDVEGDITQSRGKPTDYVTGAYYEGCVRSTVVGADGTLYTLATTNNSNVGMIKAIKNDVEYWSYTLPCGASVIDGGMVVGVDGNVYLSFRANEWPCSTHWRLMGLSATAPTGTTTPTVLVDESFTLSGDSVLWGGISAYSSGIALRTTAGVRYYEYDGDLVDAIDIAKVVNSVHTEYLDTDLAGQIIIPVKASSSVIQQCNNDSWTAGALQAYGPSGHQWTYSLEGCIKMYEVRPSPYGAIVHYTMPDGGVYGNTVRDYLQAFDADGVSQWRVQVSSNDPSVVDRWMMLSVDLNGNAALIRQVTKTVRTSGGAYYYYPEVRLDLLSGTSGNSIGNYDFVGDQVEANGNGYRWDGYSFPAMAHGIWYVPVTTCWHWDSCNWNEAKLYPVTAPGLEMDYPRGAVLGQTGAKNVPMAAMGDSFSSGLGALAAGRSYEGGGCRRSPSAYGRFLGDDLGLKLRLPKPAFTACAGATSSQMLGNAQVNSIPTNAKAVFLTAGGNDVKFARLGALCIFIDCATSGYETEFGTYLDGLDTNLATLYAAIAARAPDAEIYVLTYPRIYPITNCSGEQWLLDLEVARSVPGDFYEEGAIAAGLLAGEAEAAVSMIPSISVAEIAFTSDFVTGLNEEIEDSVFTANVQHDNRFHLVDTNALGSPFYGHELCTSEPYFNGLDLAVPANTFHPNIAGQWAMYGLGREAVEYHQPQYIVAG